MDIKLHVLVLFQASQLVSSACSGSGFPTEWTTTTPGVTFWFVTNAIKRQFSASYTMTDYRVSNSLVYGTAPTCEDEYYDPSSGYYYYLMYFPDVNIYSTGTNRQICHAFKQFDNVIREYYEDLNAPGVLSAATDCVSRFASSTLSLALTKYNFQYVNCPFSNVDYYFTFSNGGNADYCSGQASSAIIGNEVISLKSCFDFNSVSKANPFYGAFSCLGTWTPESRDTTTSGDFIVVEMYDTSAWPYCGRYKVAADGTITLSLYLSMSEDDWFPVFCDATKDNEYYFESGTTKYVRMVFTPVNPVTQASDTTTETETTSTESTTTSTTQEATTTSTTQEATTTSTTQEETTTTETTTTTASQTTTTSDTVTATTVTTTTGNSTSTSSNSSIWDEIRNLYWPWWILVAASIVLIATLIFCIAYACLRKRRKHSKVENLKQQEQAQTKQSYTSKLGQPHYPSSTKDKHIGQVTKIQVKSINQTKGKESNNKTTNGLDF